MNATGIYELVGGPHDGGRVREAGGQIPGLIFLGPHWMPTGDGAYAQWMGSGSARFPARYSRHNGRYHFAGWW